MSKIHQRARRPVLRLSNLEDRLAPAVFNIPAGDIAAFRAAITTSNSNNQPDTINLASGTYAFTDVADPLDGGNALPSVLSDTNNVVNTLTINGNGTTLLRSAAAGTPFFRFFRENLSAPLNAPPTLTINGVTFTNGRIDAATSLLGGAIYLAGGNLTLADCTFNSNQAPNGGAIGADQVTTSPRPLDINRCTFTQNSATGGTGNGAGGAIYSISSSVLRIADSTFTGNTSTAEGGAVRVQTSSTTTTISGSSFTTNIANGGNGGGAVFIQGTTVVSATNISNNTSAVGGGGLFVQGTLTLTDSTISNNLANGVTSSGGGVFVQGDFTMGNTTVHGNRASSGGGVAYTLGGNIATVTNSTVTDNRVFSALASGGGVRVQGSNFQMGNTIVANNIFEVTVSSGTGPDIAGTVASLGYNLVGNGSGATFTGVTTGNQVGTPAAPINPQLGALQNNGGKTPTRLPLAGSPIINAGDPAFASPPGPAFDQRGNPFARVQFGRIDIGATEAQAARVLPIVVNDGSLQRSRVTSLTVTFSSVVTLPPTPVNAFRLERTGPGATGDVGLTVDSFSSTPTQTTVKLTFNGQFTDFGSLIDGNYRLTVFGNQVTGEGGLALDGNGDGTAGGDNTQTLFRLYGDINGDRTVNGLDLPDFRTAFGTSVGNPNYFAYLDYNGDGVINGLDLAEYRTRFGTTLLP